jgi:disulfide bond formation protein DsbB
MPVSSSPGATRGGIVASLARATSAGLGAVADGLDALLEMRAEAWLGAISLSLLLGALAFQYIGGLVPCDLCMKQRWAHGMIVGLALMSLSAEPSTRRRVTGLAVLSAAFSLSFGIALFHVGVEQHWWAASCSVRIPPGRSVEDILAELAAAPLVKCDEVAWQMLGVSMAGWNAIVSAACATFAARRGLVTLRGARLSARMRHALRPSRLPLRVDPR